MVALEQLFAATSRGAALINRIKADPRWSCEIRIVSHEPADADRRHGPPLRIVVEDSRVRRRRRSISAARGARRVQRDRRHRSADRRQPGDADQPVGRRRAGRLADDPQAESARAHDRSIDEAARSGHGRRGLGAFEMPKGTACYRAGIEFFDAGNLDRFIDANKARTMDDLD